MSLKKRCLSPQLQPQSQHHPFRKEEEETVEAVGTNGQRESWHGWCVFTLFNSDSVIQQNACDSLHRVFLFAVQIKTPAPVTKKTTTTTQPKKTTETTSSVGEEVMDVE